MRIANAGTNLVEMHLQEFCDVRRPSLVSLVSIFLGEGFRVAPVTQTIDNLVLPANMVIQAGSSGTTSPQRDFRSTPFTQANISRHKQARLAIYCHSWPAAVNKKSSSKLQQG